MRQHLQYWETTWTKCWLASQRLILAWPLLPLFDLKLQSRGQDRHALRVMVAQLYPDHWTVAIKYTSFVQFWCRATHLLACCIICLNTKHKLLNAILGPVRYVMCRTFIVCCDDKMPGYGYDFSSLTGLPTGEAQIFPTGFNLNGLLVWTDALIILI